MNAKDEFSARLRAAMTAAGIEISGTELERAFNRRWHKAPITVQTAWNWINGKTEPRKDRLQLLSKLLKADPHALQYGASGPLTTAEGRRAWEDGVTYAERETIEAFLRLPTQQRLVVREVITAFVKAYGAIEPDRD